MNIPRLFAPTKMMHALNWVASSANFYFMFSLVTHCVHIAEGCCCGFYARKQLLLSAHLSHRNSVCLSVTRVYQSKTVQARITKFALSAARKTLVSGTVKLFHKFEGGHPERER